MAFDKKLRRKLNQDLNTARDLAYYLLETCPNAQVGVLGDPDVYIHIEEDKSFVSFDDNSMSDLPEYDEDDNVEVLEKYDIMEMEGVYEDDDE